MNKGFYTLRITGKNPKQFLKTLYQLHFNLYHIKIDQNSLYITIDDEHYQKLKKIKTSYEIEIVKRTGLLFIKEQLRFYAVFLIVFACSLLVLFTLSKMIFNIEVIHTNKQLREMIVDELKEEGIAKYRFQVSFAKQEQIVQKILTSHKDTLEWLEIERNGTKYTVKVEERKLVPPKESGEPSNIVAQKDGIVMQIEGESGEIICKKNQYVKKGDILISGIIKNQETEMARVESKGIIWAETWYQTTVEMPYTYYEEQLTGKKKSVLQIKFLDNWYSLFDFHPFTHKRVKEQTIIKHPILPISLQLNKEDELRVVDEVYTKETASIKASAIAREKISKTLDDGETILFQKTLKITQEESKIIVEVFFKVKENISETAPIIEEAPKPAE